MKRAILNPDGTVDVKILSKENPTTYRLTNENILQIFNIRDIDIEKATVRSLLKMMKHYPVLSHIEDFSTEYLEESIHLTPFDGQRDDKSIDYIEIRDIFDIHRSDNKAEISFVPLNDGSGCSKMQSGTPYPSENNSGSHYFTASGKYEGDDASYSLMFTPLEEIINKKLKIGQSNINVYVSLKFSEDESDNIKKVYSGVDECYPSLIDVFQSVMNELTFNGTSSDKEDKFQELQKQVEKVEALKANKEENDEKDEKD